jgi:hypothetical protein
MGGAFELVLVLLSFVYALALTHVLSRIGALVLAFKQVRFSALLALAMVNAILQVFLGWLVLWDFRGVRQWDLLSIAGQFALAIMTYFLCIFAAPERDGAVDMEALYPLRRRPFYFSVLILYVLSLGVNATLLKTPDPTLFLRMNEISVVSLIPIILPLCTPARWAQWVGGIGMLAFAITFTVEFVGTLA